MKLFLFAIFTFVIVTGCNSAGEIARKDIVKNTSYEMQCNIENKTISYCWFGAPNGTVYSLMPDPAKNNGEYSYIGEGFKNGDCGMRISSASKSDEGFWSCNMGLLDSTMDKSDQFQVSVHDTLLMTYKKKISYFDEGISCHIDYNFEGNRSLEYCRFVRPDGYGINPLPNMKHPLYSSGLTKLDKGECHLRFEKSSDSNIGKWICAAKLISSNEELYNEVRVSGYYYVYVNSGGFVALAWFMFIITMCLLCLILASTIRKRRASRNSTASTQVQPPPYTSSVNNEDVIQEKVPLP